MPAYPLGVSPRSTVAPHGGFRPPCPVDTVGAMGIITDFARRHRRASVKTAADPGHGLHLLDVDEIIEAARLVVSTRFASSALLEQRLNFTREKAVAILAKLEHCEVVGSVDGSDTRRVLTTSQELPGVIREFRDRA